MRIANLYTIDTKEKDQTQYEPFQVKNWSFFENFITYRSTIEFKEFNIIINWYKYIYIYYIYIFIKLNT